MSFVNENDHHMQLRTPTGPFSVESLRAFAQQAEVEFERLLALHPPGTYHAGRNEAHRLHQVATLCAEWMCRTGKGPLDYVGPFGVVPIRAGTRARIRQGAIVHSTSPKYAQEGKPYNGAKPVLVRRVDRGHVNIYDPEHLQVTQPKVVWAGTGGNWMSADANDAEMAE